MRSVPDLASLPLSGAVSDVVLKSGDLAGHPDLVETLGAERLLLRTSGPREGEPGFEVAIDALGRARVHATDLPALARLETLLLSAPERGAGSEGVQTLSERPAVPVRAVLECFYGPLWAPDERAAVVAGSAARGANAYVYGPSADRFTGGAWRERYAGALRDSLERLVADLHERGMTAIWRVSPGAPVEQRYAMRLTEEEELGCLLAKVGDVFEIGFDRVLIAFDDIAATVDPAVVETFVDENPVAAAHASVINAVVERWGASRVIACPTHYWGVADSGYRRRFGAVLTAGVEVCWTGPEVVSPSITTAQLRGVADQTGHPLWLWDNYPVNDWDLDGIASSVFAQHPGADNMVRARRLPLAPLTGRDGDAGDQVRAYGANAAIQPYAGLLAVQTALDWAWQGPAYDPSRSWASVLAVSGVDAESLAVLAEATGPVSGGEPRPAGQLALCCAALIMAFGTTDADGASEAVLAQVERHLRAIDGIRSASSGLTRDLQPWLTELARQCTFAVLAAEGLSGARVSRPELSGRMDDALSRPSLVSMCSSVPRAAAELARGVASGSLPEFPD